MTSLTQTGEKEPPKMPAPKWVFITPEIAAGIKSTNNRPVKMSVVKEYKRIMESGLWVLSPHGITLDTNGLVSDGNHRMHALAIASVSGFWFLVCDWSIHAQELRVDRGSMRSVGDFIGLTPAQSSPISFLAQFAGIGGMYRRDPSELSGVVETFGQSCNRLLEICNATRRGRSSAPVRAGIAVAMHGKNNRERDDLCMQYRHFVVGSNESWNSFISLARCVDIKKMDAVEIFVRSHKAATRPDLDRITYSSSLVTDLREFVKNAILNNKKEDL